MLPRALCLCLTQIIGRQRGGVGAVDWSENVAAALQDAIRVTIEKDPQQPDTRHITITGGDRFEAPCL